MSTSSADRRRALDLRADLAPKVPHVALTFWVVKLLTTGMGEAMSDFLAGIDPVVAVGAGFLAFAIAVLLQLRRADYSPVTYWSAVAMVAVFGTMAADAVHVVLGIPYPVTSAAYAVAVLAVLAVWRRVEGSVSIHSITTRRRELFYWAAVLSTFALGTAVGDLTAFSLHLGYRASIVLFAALMLVPLVGWRTRLMGPVTAFWTAYVLTRPLGASIADWLGKPPGKGSGLGWGDGPVSLGALVIFLALLAWLAATGRDRPRVADVDDATDHRA